MWIKKFGVIFKPIYRSLVFISRIIGWVNTRLLLGAIFYIVISPIGLVMRILRKDPLNRKFDRARESYWILRGEGFDPASCERQF